MLPGMVARNLRYCCRRSILTVQNLLLKISDNFLIKQNLKHLQETSRSGPLLFQVGVSCYRKGDSLECFIKRSDKALYFAKNSGRNMVAIESDAV